MTRQELINILDSLHQDLRRVSMPADSHKDIQGLVQSYKQAVQHQITQEEEHGRSPKQDK